MLWQNPFSFDGFLMQISESSTIGDELRLCADEMTVCITLGPTFYTAAIYLTLSKMCV